MPITQVDIDGAEELIEELLGNQDEAEAYSKDPQGWLGEHGYENLNPEAVAQCGAAYGGAGVAAYGGSAAAAGSGVAGVAAALDPIVYNNYYEVDNSITNNIENHGNLDFTQQVGEGNINVEDSTVEGDIQSQTGDGIQFGDDADVDNSNLNTGDDNQQAIDQSTNTDIDVNVDAGGDDGGDGDGGGEGLPQQAPGQMDFNPDDLLT
jgi:hypothetical protein